MTTELADTKQKLYEHVRKGAEEAEVFAEVEVTERGVRCEAKESVEPAFYWCSIEEGDIWVSLETEDRWLSGSIEAELVATGDKLDELIEEEVVEQGHVDAVVEFEHHRTPEKVYVFRSKVSTPLSDPKAPEHALAWLLGYEAAFRDLGDMSEDDED